MNFRHTSWIVALSFVALGSIFYFNDDSVDRSALSASDRAPVPGAAPQADPVTIPARPHASSPRSTLPASDRAPQRQQKIARQPLPKGSIVDYETTLDDFPNPERGFHDVIDLMSAKDLSSVRRNGYSLARTYIRLDEYRNRPLPTAFLTKLDRQFQLSRQAGIKLVVRFSYNFPTTEQEINNAPDASLKLTLSHIQQLKPILAANADVITTLQAGFIGAWGEWHSSGNKLDRPEAKTKILTALLAALPPTRMVQLRYVNDIQTNYPQPLTIAGAFQNTRQARTAFHNDCFLANQSDAGTYKPDLPRFKNYVSQIAPFIAVGGETCDVTQSDSRTDCPSAESDLSRFHWSYLNAHFYKPVFERWKQEGCYDRIATRLGYRLQLVRSEFPTQITANLPLQGGFAIKNVGYASPYNPRGLELILRHQRTGKIYRLSLLKSLDKTRDPRFWQPKMGTISVPISTKIPKTAPLGTYDLLLNLPDPAPKLANRPEYAMRLANQDTWEAKTGFNSLRRTIELRK
jgi:hypothetical protein